MAEEGEVFLFYYQDRDFAFINELKHYLEELLCPVCRQILQDPVQTSCGHSFCCKCLGLSQRARRLQCHVCRQECTVSKDPKEARRVNNLQVKCPNHSEGCKWKGTLGDSAQHCTRCPFEVIHCPNSPEGCTVKLQRIKMQNHAARECKKRKHHCQFCNKVGVYSLITGEHLQMCHRYPIACPNDCGQTEIPREYLDSHREKCLKEVLPCKFADIGCTKKVQRQSVQEHLKTEKDQHLDQALMKIAEMTIQFKELQEQVTRLQEMVTQLQETQEEPKRQLISPTPFYRYRGMRPRF